MGKKSLIKSTAKKKSGAKEGEEKTAKKAASKTTKKTAAKTTKKAAPKTAKKAAPKKAAPKKTAPKKTAAKKAAPAKAKAKPKKAVPPKKVSVKELVFKKFAPIHDVPAPISAPMPAATHASAPPLIGSTDAKEVERLRGLLFKPYNMDDIKKAAKAPEPKAAEPVQAETPVVADADPIDAAQSAPDEPEESDAYITIEPDAQQAENEPLATPVKIGLAAAAIIVFLLLAISYNNASKFYLLPKDKAVEVWKGRFSPKDNRYFMVLHGTQLAGPAKDVYTKQEVFPLIYTYYIGKADNLLDVKGLPDFEGIKSYLGQAKDFAITNEMKNGVALRSNNIERMILLYKADVSLSKNTENSISSAIKLLKQAAKLTPSATQAEMISKKIESARALSAKLKGELK